MGDPGRELIAGVRRTMAEERRRLGEPPTPDELIAYAEGTLPESERGRIEAFTTADPQVARTLIDLESFPEVEPAAAGEELSEDELAAGWEDLRDGLREAGVLPGEPAAVGPPAPPPGRRGAALGSRAGQLAAVLAVTTVGLGLYVAGLHLSGRVGGPGPPRLNPVVKSLLPVGAGGERSSGEVEAVALPPTSDSLVLILSVLEAPATPGIRLEVYDASGRRVWQTGGLVRNPDGTFSVDLPRGLLAPGRYRLELVGTDGRHRPIATYELDLAIE